MDYLATPMHPPCVSTPKCPEVSIHVRITWPPMDADGPEVLTETLDILLDGLDQEFYRECMCIFRS